MKNPYLLVLCLAFFAACGDDTKKEPEITDIPKPQVNISAGVVHKSLEITGKPNETYALYLPKSFSFEAKKEYAVLYCADPQGFGAIPLLKYRALADEYEFILVGSNVCRNGMEFDVTDRSLHELVREVQNLYPVEDSVRLLGFSGGARVVFHYADMNPRVSQIVYVGGVYPLKRTSGISLLGIAGIRDMNYGDMVSFEVSLGKAPFRHHLIQTDGQHDYPAEKDMRDAFIWMKTGHVEGYDEKRVKMSQEALMREQLLKRKFYQAFGKQDITWWRQEIKALHEFKKEDVLYERVLGFIGLSCYSYAGQAIKAGDYDKADYIVQIYEMATPTNEDAKKFRKAINDAKMRK